MRLSLPRKTMGAASNLGVRARDARSYGVLLSFLNEEECPGPAYQVAVLLLPYQHSLLTIISVVCSYSQSRSRIFRGGLRVGGSATHFSATHPYRNSRIGSGRHALAALLVQVCEGPQKGSSEKILQGTSGYRSAAGHDNSSKCFIVIFGYAPISWPAFKDCASPRAQPRDVRNLSPSGRLPLPGCTLRGPQRAYLD